MANATMKADTTPELASREKVAQMQAQAHLGGAEKAAQASRYGALAGIEGHRLTAEAAKYGADTGAASRAAAAEIAGRSKLAEIMANLRINAPKMAGQEAENAFVTEHGWKRRSAPRTRSAR